MIPSNSAQLLQGDVILSINSLPISGMQSFEDLYNQTIKEKDDRVLLEVKRDRDKFDAVLEVKKYAPATEPGD